MFRNLFAVSCFVPYHSETTLFQRIFQLSHFARNI